MSRRRRRLTWLTIVLVFLAALAVGATRQGAPRTVEERVDRIAAPVKCPTCVGQSASQSDAPASRAIRDEIERRLQLGQSDDEIRSYLASRFGVDILLAPPSRGLARVVWLLPIVVGGVAVGALAVALRRWRPREPRPRCRTENSSPRRASN